LALVEDNLGQMEKPIRMYGYLVHNEEVIEKLLKKGITVVDSLTGLRKGTLIITAHGISPKTREKLLKRKGLRLMETTCPKVLLVQNLARHLFKEGRQVLIFGEAAHQEVKGIKGAADDRAIVFSSEEEFNKININQEKKYGLVVQTTKNFEEFEKLREKIKERIKDIKVFNTICQATRQRQSEVRKLAKEHDSVLVVGSRLSANTNRLYEISLGINPESRLISNSREIKKNWFRSKKSVGLTAGASTPDWIINQVVQEIKKTGN